MDPLGSAGLNLNLGPFALNPSNGVKKEDLNGLQGKIEDNFSKSMEMQMNNLRTSVSEPLSDWTIETPDPTRIRRTASSDYSPVEAVKDFVLEVDSRQKQAGSLRRSVLSGETNNLHQSMIASQEASVSFTLMLEMRNKMMETYQELMRLQL